MDKVTHLTLTDLSPGTETTAIGQNASVLSNIDDYGEIIQVTGFLQGATGGTLDILVQRKVNNTWVDWLRFAQLADSAAAIVRAVPVRADTQVAADHIVTVGSGTTPALAAATFAGGHPGSDIRFLFIAGAGTSAGASQTVVLTALK